MITVAASNEIPHTEELEALYDRFLIRKEVIPVSDRAISNLLLLPMKRSSPPPPMITEKLIADIKLYSNDVIVPTEVIDIFRDIRIYLRDEVDPPVYVSDRRLIKSIAMLKVSAFTNNRNYVSIVDTLLLTHTLWYNPDERKSIRSFLLKNMIPDIQSYKFIYDSLKNSIIKTLENTSSSSSVSTQVSELESLSKIIAKKIAMMRMLIFDFNHHLWLSSTDLTELRQQLSPKAKDNADELERLMLSINVLVETLNNSNGEVDDIKTVLDKVPLTTTDLKDDNTNDNDKDYNDDDIFYQKFRKQGSKKKNKSKAKNDHDDY